MRFSFEHLLTAWILVAMIVGPGLAGAETRSNLAVRGEGYIGYSRIDIDTGSTDTDADGFEGGGTGSVSVLFDSIYLQADLFGDASEFDSADPDRVGAAGHLGWRDATRGSLGVVGAINHVDAGGSDTDEWRTGVEGQVFFERFTGGLDAGFFDGNASSDANGSELVYLLGNIAFYPNDRTRLNFRGGALGVGKDDPAAILSAGGEFMIMDFLSAFGRWEASLLDDSGLEVDEHSVVAGVRLYWGSNQPSLKSYDREHFNESCLGIRRVGRSC